MAESRPKNRTLIVNERALDENGNESTTQIWELSADEMSRLERLKKRFAYSRPFFSRRTDNVDEALWSELERFSGADAVNRILPPGLKAERVESTVRDVRQSIRLASAYFESYRRADPVIGPTLLYYGALNLAAAVIVGKTQRGVPHSHGVKALSPSPDGTFALSEWSVCFGKSGVHQELAAALGGDRLNSKRNDTVPVYELLRLLPDLDEVMRDFTGAGTVAVPVHKVENRDSNLMMQLSLVSELSRIPIRRHLSVEIDDHNLVLGDGVEEAIAVYPALQERNLVVNHVGALCWQAPGDAEDDFRTLTTSTPYGAFFESRLSNGTYLPEMAAMLALLHFMSHLSRYLPDQWLGLLDRRPDDFSILRAFLTVAEKKVANLALNELSGRVYSYEHT